LTELIAERFEIELLVAVLLTVWYVGVPLMKADGKLRPTLAKTLTNGFVAALFAAELLLLFAPFGPVTQARRYFQRSAQTRERGLRPCVGCGRPTEPQTYRSNRGGWVTRTEYCKKCAPSSIDLSSSVTSYKIAQMIFGALLLLLAFLMLLLGFTFMDKEHKPPETLAELRKTPAVGMAILNLFFFGVATLFFL
jgi:hypothetical protein